MEDDTRNRRNEKWQAANHLSAATSLLVIWAITIGAGCQIPRALTRSDIDASSQGIRVRSVRLIDGTEIDFRSDPPGYAVLRDSAIVRTLVDGTLVEIPLDSVELGRSTRYPTAGEHAVQILIVAAATAGVLILLMTHPFQFHH